MGKTRLAALLVVGMILSAGTIQADEVEFTPTLFLYGTMTDNVYRSSTAPVHDEFLYATIELPFRITGPRWSGGFNLRPGLQKHRDIPSLDEFDSDATVSIDGELGRRTSLSIDGSLRLTPELVGLGDMDVLAPRTRQSSAGVQTRITHQLGARDSIGFGAEYRRYDYRDDALRGYDDFGGIVDYSRTLSRRTSFLVSVTGNRISYQDGRAVDGLSAQGGARFVLAPRTNLRLTGGLTWARGDRLDTGTGSIDQRRRSTWAARGRLDHQADDFAVDLSVERGLSGGAALDLPTIRTQVTGGISTGFIRWRLGASGGFARSQSMFDDPGLGLVTQDGVVVTDATEVDTWGTCVDLSFRVNHWLSLVSAYRYAYQAPRGASRDLAFDVYRLSLGIAIHPYAAPMRPNGPGSVDLELAKFRRMARSGTC